MNVIFGFSSQKLPPWFLMFNSSLIEIGFAFLRLIFIDDGILKKFLNFIRFSIFGQLYGQLGLFIFNVSVEEVD
jgi:hypothetical protein